MKKAIILAGGYDQIALIKELQERDIYCILIDYFDNPPAKGIADKHIKGSTLDVDFVREHALKENADYIITACTDQALLTMAKVSEDLKLPSYIDYKTALNVTNKVKMKDILIENHIPTSRYLKIHNQFDEKAISNLTFPLVVKPADCNSSKGVKKVFSIEELKEELHKALEFSRSHNAIIEEFKEGRELSADFYIDQGRAILLGVTESTKIPNNNGSFTIKQSLYPVTSNEQNIQISEIAQRIAEAFNIENAPMLVQLIDTGSQFFVIEFSARMGGGSKYRLIEEISGVDIMKQYVNLVLGKPVEIHPHPADEFIALNYVYCHPGTMQRLVNFNKNQDKGVIECYFPYKTPGMIFEKAETSGDRAAGYLVKAPNEIEREKRIQQCDSSLKVIDPSGFDLMIHDLNS